jgi:hypothetical protein
MVYKNRKRQFRIETSYGAMISVARVFVLFMSGSRAVTETHDRTRCSSTLRKDEFDWDAWQIGTGKPYAAVVESNGKRDASFLDGTCFADRGWNILPSIATLRSIKVESPKGEASVVDATTLHVDGHSVRGRMALLRYLIEEWEDSLLFPKLNLQPDVAIWGSSGSTNEYHWLWAYGAQLDWQQRSGRLAIGMDEPDDGDHISVRSWWGYMNYCFSVAVLLGAIEATNSIQTIDDVQETAVTVELDADSQRLMEEDYAVRDCVTYWRDFFQCEYPNYQTRIRDATKQLDEKPITTNNIKEEDFQRLRFEFQKEVWKVHTKVIERAASSARSKQLLNVLPKAEQQFGLGWSRMVDILAASVFPTDLVTLIEDGSGFLPYNITMTTALRQKTPKVVIENPASYRDPHTRRNLVAQSQQRSIDTTHQLVLLPDWALSTMVHFWSRVVRQPWISREMPARVNRLVHGSVKVKLKELFRVLVLFVKPKI